MPGADRIIKHEWRSEASPPTVSIVTSMRNSAATVGVCIRSLLWQTVDDWELVLLDDGSSDGSVLPTTGELRHRL